jgi:hypothetical protein
MGSVGAVSLFVMFYFLLSWLSYSFQPLQSKINQSASDVVRRLFVQPSAFPPEAAGPTWVDALLQIWPSLILVSIFAMGLLFWYKRELILRTDANLTPPDPHRGLILLLGPYGVRYNVTEDVRTALDIPPDFEALQDRIAHSSAGADEALRHALFSTKWGPLWAAVEHHAPALEYCWIISSAGGSDAQSETAAKIVEKAVATHPEGGTVTCYTDMVVDDAHDISTIVPVADRIYRDLAVDALDEREVIADFTGATAGMSAGLVLTTLDERRKIQYLRQDRPLIVSDENGPRAKTIAELQVPGSEALVMVQTRRDFVPAKPE